MAYFDKFKPSCVNVGARYEAVLPAGRKRSSFFRRLLMEKIVCEAYQLEVAFYVLSMIAKGEC